MNCGPSFGVGDTVVAGWLPNGSVFFTYNGRHLGIAFSRVEGTLYPAIDFDTPGACCELVIAGSGNRVLKYTGDGRPPDLIGTSAETRLIMLPGV